ncbi:Uncharacterised protein [Klebsiella pneumoniae]|nr:Uncharacterised protein [Klebsiella pneumoniae]
MGTDIVRIKRRFRLWLKWIDWINRTDFNMTLTHKTCTNIFRYKIQDTFFQLTFRF